MGRSDTKVLGYFAYSSPTQVVCTDVDACLVSGSRTAMERYLAETHPQVATKATVSKTRFAEILKGLELGAAYAFDKHAYSRFYPLPREAGIPVDAADFEGQQEEGWRFFTVRLAAR